MQPPDTTDAPIVPFVAETETAQSSNQVASDGGRPAGWPFDRPPRTDYAAEYTRDEEEIEPFVADLR
jgi:hypothetical protein